ncbi:hypothetical protein MCHI_003792 [Candidatus Magnetoovum chiemensis]|nr:hypothetical protein MCHI_003792 [Candidatus Magnetoovum chiemensis]
MKEAVLELETDFISEDLEQNCEENYEVYIEELIKELRQMGKVELPVSRNFRSAVKSLHTIVSELTSPCYR